MSKTSHTNHKKSGAQAEAHPNGQAECPIPVAVLTVSDTRTFETDESGRLIQTMIEAAGHSTHFYQIVRDSRHEIKEAIQNILKKSEVGVIIVTGGSGVSKRDVTPESVSKFFKRALPGFGEFFRMLSLAEVGTSALLSRATAGQTRNGTFIFVLPGSTNAVTLGLEKLILPELQHLERERTK